jgi:hypothetical protein
MKWLRLVQLTLSSSPQEELAPLMMELPGPTSLPCISEGVSLISEKVLNDKLSDFEGDSEDTHR